MKKKIVALLLGAVLCFSTSEVNAVQTYYNECVEIGDMYGISPELLQAVIFYESNYNPNLTNSLNATGLMQIIPKWNRERMRKLGVTNLKNPYDNILVGADLLAELYEKYEDNYLVLMCYNQGEYGGAKKQWERGQYSKYAKKIMKKTYELEEINGKHDY